MTTHQDLCVFCAFLSAVHCKVLLMYVLLLNCYTDDKSDKYVTGRGRVT